MVFSNCHFCYRRTSKKKTAMVATNASKKNCVASWQNVATLAEKIECIWFELNFTITAIIWQVSTFQSNYACVGCNCDPCCLVPFDHHAVILWKSRNRYWSWRAYIWWRVHMKVVMDVHTTQRMCKRTSGRTRDVPLDGGVCISGRTCERTYVRWHVHSSLICHVRARTTIRSTRVHLISVRLKFPT
jgi:hypothetical protein